MAEKPQENELLQKAMMLCSKREYCSSDIAARIEQWGERDKSVTDRIIERLKAERFIDDSRYCRAFVLDHFRYQRWGRKKIMMSLKMKRLAGEAISVGLGAIEEEEYRRVLREIIENHRKSIKAKNRFDLKNKLLRHALAKGYESDLVFEVINSLFDE